MQNINYIYQNTKFLHCTTDQEKKLTKKYLPKFNYEIFPNIISEKSNSLKFNYKKRKDYLYLGRLHQKKNIDQIIMAFLLAQKKIDPRIKLFLGKGDQKWNYLKEIVKEKIYKIKLYFWASELQRK